MIKKVLLSLALVLAGLGVMHFFIGWENFATVEQQDGDDPITRRERSMGGFVVGDAGDSDTAVSASSSGLLELARNTEVLLPNGDKLFLPTYRLVAENHEPVMADLVRMQRVRVDFFERDDSGAVPRAVHVGRLRAAEALVQVGRDEKGEPSIREDRDMELFDVVLTTESDARIKNLLLEVDRVMVRHSASGIHFETPRDDQPFHLEMGSDDERTTLDGRGLVGFLPPAKTDGATPNLELHVRSKPVLWRGKQTQLRADGPLDYVEDVATGFGQVAMRDRVVIEGLTVEEGGTPTAATGDRLSGELLRRRNNQPGTERSPMSAVWRRLDLTGRPATFEADGISLRCRDLHVSPSLRGKPYLITASGQPILSTDTGAEFAANERIHLVRLTEMLLPIYRAFGFRGAALPSLAHELIIFEGAATIADPTNGLSVEAVNGLRVLRSGARDPMAVIRGGDDVKIVRGELTATGNAGFTVRQGGSELYLQLGSDDPGPADRFALRQGGTSGLTVDGHGACTVVQDKDGVTRVDLRSPVQDIVLELSEGSLAQVRQLQATFAGQELRDLEAWGDTCRLTRPVPGDGGPSQPIVVEAQRIHSGDGRSFAFFGLGRPASLTRGLDKTVTGARIDVHRFAGDAVLVDVRGAPGGSDSPDRAHIVFRADPERADQVAGDLLAERVRLLPYLVPPAVLRLYGAPGHVPLLAPSMQNALVIADGQVEIAQSGGGPAGVGTGRGQQLLMRADGSAGLLSGAPAELAHNGGDRRGFARALRVRIGTAPDGGQVATLLDDPGFDPWIEVRSQPGTRSGAFSDVRARCRGPVRYTADTVSFDGPVHIQALDEDGRIDPRGLDITAATMTMQLDAGTREIERITASGDVHLEFRDVVADGDEMTVDQERTLCIVRSKSGAVTVTTGGQRALADEVWLDYRTYAVKTWNLRSPGISATALPKEEPAVHAPKPNSSR